MSETPRRTAATRPLWRRLVQGGFALAVIAGGIQFYFWAAAVRSGTPPAVGRPAIVDAFLPISGLVGLRHWFSTGELVPVHPAAVLILLGAIITAVVLKRGFCSWICPIFLIGELGWRGGERLWKRTFAPPFWLDLILRLLKYLILGFFVWSVVLAMSPPAAKQFLLSPFHKIADIRMLDFFLNPSSTTLIVLGVLLVLSVLIQMPWCRYLCPYGALLGILSIFSLAKVSRHEAHCIRCGRCSDRCTAWLPVRNLKKVRSAECYACFRCIEGCPAPGALSFDLPKGVKVSPLWFGVAIVSIFLVIDAIARWQGMWNPVVDWQQLHQILLRFGR